VQTDGQTEKVIPLYCLFFKRVTQLRLLNNNSLLFYPGCGCNLGRVGTRHVTHQLCEGCRPRAVCMGGRLQRQGTHSQVQGQPRGWHHLRQVSIEAAYQTCFILFIVCCLQIKIRSTSNQLGWGSI